MNFCREMKFGNAVLQSIAVAEMRLKFLTWIEGVSSGIERDPSALDGLPHPGDDSKSCFLSRLDLWSLRTRGPTLSALKLYSSSSLPPTPSGARRDSLLRGSS